MPKLNLAKVKEVVTIFAAICGAIAGLWGAFKPEKKAEASYTVLSKKIVDLESELILFYQVSDNQQQEIASLTERLAGCEKRSLDNLLVSEHENRPILADATSKPKAKSLTRTPAYEVGAGVVADIKLDEAVKTSPEVTPAPLAEASASPPKQSPPDKKLIPPKRDPLPTFDALK